MKGISAQDWITLAIGVIGLLSAYLQSRLPKLPSWARKWMDKLGEDELFNAVIVAEKLISATPEERRIAAAEYLKKVAKRKLDLTLPTSIANWLVEYAYQIWKRR